MIRTGQILAQRQSLQQKLSPQQIQYVKLLQLPTLALEQRVKEELESNPILEDISLGEGPLEGVADAESPVSGLAEGDPQGEDGSSDELSELDWEPFLSNTEYEADPVNSAFRTAAEERQEIPNPYHESFLERLEQQVGLLHLDEDDHLIAEQILGSLDEDGYFRRDPEAVVDNIAFNHGVMVTLDQVEHVRSRIQRLDPVGIASLDLQECLAVQLDVIRSKVPLAEPTLRMIRQEWEAFQKKQFDRLKTRLKVDDEELREMFELVRSLNPRPGSAIEPEEERLDYIEPDFEVTTTPAGDGGGDGTVDGGFTIRLNHRNAPQIRISPKYKQLWDSMKGRPKGANPTEDQTRTFIKEKVESAQWFLDSIRQRQKTLIDTMSMIVELQPDFFRTGSGLRPMILKDIAERIGLDISTISRVVNGKFVQTPHGVYELKYFFTEGLTTESGEEISNREIQQEIQRIVEQEDKNQPLSDQEIMERLSEKGYKVARRTVSKYREILHIPVARMRREIV